MEGAEETLAFCRALPKVELHAHINGCIRDSTLSALCRDSADPEVREFVVPPAEERSLSQCFQLFDVIHKAVSSIAAVERVAAEVIEDFAADGVCYCELRSAARSPTTPPTLPSAQPLVVGVRSTTPRGDCTDRDGRVASRADYVRAISSVVRRSETLPSSRSMVVRLLLSVDRSRTPAEALEVVRLAHEFSAAGGGEGGGYVVGVDFSGNPASGEFGDFEAVFAEARRLGLPIAAHVGEL